MPLPALERLEQSARLGQGKGWGSSTVSQEVNAALSLLSPNEMNSLVALDVGANVGCWTSAFLKATPNAKIYAFEPSKTAFHILQQTLGNDERVHLINRALGAEEGDKTLFADAAGSGLGSLTKRKLDHLNIDFGYSETVAVTTLDQWIAANPTGGGSLILKMDVEGHELDVLHGAAITLENISVVQFEFGGCNIDTRTYFQDFFYFFEEAGFRLFRLGPKGLSLVANYKEIDEVFTTTNYFAQRL